MVLSVAAVTLVGCGGFPGSGEDPFEDEPMNTTELETDCNALFGVSCETFNGHYIKAPEAQRGQWFGNLLRVDGDTLVVGTPRDDTAGAGVNGDFDEALAGSGAVWVYVRGGDGWSLQARIKEERPLGLAGFGRVTAIDGDILAVTAVGAHDDDLASGVVEVYHRSGATWTHEATLSIDETTTAGRFAESLAVDGNFVVAGSPGDGASTSRGEDDTLEDAGAVHVFERSPSGVWAQHAYVKAPTISGGAEFGKAVAMEDGLLAVSAGEGMEAGGGETLGGVYLYELSGNSWGVVGVLDTSGSSFLDVDGRRVIAERGSNADIYIERDGTWSLEGSLRPRFASSHTGVDRAVALEGDLAFVSVPYDQRSGSGLNVPGETSVYYWGDRGNVNIFRRTGSDWNWIALLMRRHVGDNAQERFGQSIAVEDGVLFVGAPGEDSGASGIDGDETDESVLDAGAVFTYRVSEP